jgi:DNA-binding MarR family transcriptional regulator
MLNNQFTKGELYSFVTGKASTAISRRLQKKFAAANLAITIEQWSVLYQLWKKNGLSQQELCDVTFRDKPSVTRLVDNLEKQELVKRTNHKTDRRKNVITTTKKAMDLQEKTMQLANEVLNEALEGIPDAQVEMCKQALQIIYNNLAGISILKTTA